MAATFELKHTSSGKPMFNLKAANGQVILTSETYNSLSAAKNGVESVRKNASDDARFEIRANKNDEPYFILKAANGQEIGRSETYSSMSAAKKGIASVQKNAQDARVDDVT